MDATGDASSNKREKRRLHNEEIDTQLAERCFFDCSKKNTPLITCGAQRVNKIIECGVRRGDDMSGLRAKLTNDIRIRCHKNCVSTYTSDFHIKSSLQQRDDGAKRTSSVPPPSKRSRRSDDSRFNFEEFCIFCGECCSKDIATKHPDRHSKVHLCQTVGPRLGIECSSFKQRILDVCDQRKDSWADQVRIRIQGAISDLHAAGARYHGVCRLQFMNRRPIKTVDSPSMINSEDSATWIVFRGIRNDPSRIWTSVELHNMYLHHGGQRLSRKVLIKEISKHFGREILVLSSIGVCSIIVMRQTAANVFKIVDTDDDLSTSVTDVAKNILKETKELELSKSTYQLRMTKDNSLNDVSPTLMSLLSQISGKFDNTLQGIMIGNMITGAVHNHATQLQIALGVLLRSKQLINTFYHHGVTSSYDEILRFKHSVAHAASSDEELNGLMAADKGLIQAVADNFDASISSQNRLQSTHAIALLLTQIDSRSTDACANADGKQIRRVTKEEMKDIGADVPVINYNGPKQPAMPNCSSMKFVPPLSFIARQVISVERAHTLDAMFIQSITRQPDTPEYGGFNTKLMRESGCKSEAATKAAYTPLIDMVPSDPTSMLTVMIEAKKRTEAAGQEYTIFTVDQQLYKVVVGITWVYPSLFKKFIPRLGGMHMLMSFVGAIGSLMENSGLEEVMSAAFGGVSKMLSGKHFPQNTRALRLVVEELLRATMERVDIGNHMRKCLEQISSGTRTSKLWIDNLIKPVFLMMMFTRAEREGDWPLHLFVVRLMLPYFFAARHHNYARYGLYYLRSMESLPDAVAKRFLKGEHVMRHRRGLWNGIWSDMYIETTFMRYGHGPNGLIGITQSPATVKRWALSLHACNRLLFDLDQMQEKCSGDTTSHKEELRFRIDADRADRNKIKEKLALIIDPLSFEEHSNALVNVVTGEISKSNANVDKSVELGEDQMRKYENNLPTGFHDKISSNIVTMAVNKKHVKVGEMCLFDTELIYSRLLTLMANTDFKLDHVFKFELSPVPTSLFDKNGNMRCSGAKSILKQKLQVNVIAKQVPTVTAIFLDGCAILWSVYWPKSGYVSDYVSSFIKYLLVYVKMSDTYLIFDRYKDYSIKSCMRNSRKKASKSHVLQLTSLLPPQDVVLTVPENKAQLITIICNEIVKTVSVFGSCSNKLVVTGPEEAPIEIWKGTCRHMEEMGTTHEEADVIIVQQVVRVSKSGAASIKVVCDDTDVFVLLLHFYTSASLQNTIIMESTNGSKSQISCRFCENPFQHCAIALGYACADWV